MSLIKSIILIIITLSLSLVTIIVFFIIAIIFIFTVIRIILYGFKLTTKENPQISEEYQNKEKVEVASIREKQEEKSQKIIRKIKIGKKFKDNITYIEDLKFSPNAQYIGLIFKVGWRKNYYIQISDAIFGSGSRIFGPFDYANHLTFSPDSSKYAFIFQQNNKYYVQLNYETLGSFDYAQYLTFSPDSSKYLFHFYEGDLSYDEIELYVFAARYKHYIQINDKKYGPYQDYIVFGTSLTSESTTSFSPNSSRYGWLYWQYDAGFEPYIQIDDVTYGPYIKATFTFTKDNKAFIAFIKSIERKLIIIQEV